MKKETLKERALERGPDRKERPDHDAEHPPSTRIHLAEWVFIIACAGLLVWLFA